MLSRSIINTVKKSICNNARTLYWTGDRLQSNLFTYNNIRQYIIPKDCNKMDVTKRFKSKKQRYQDEDSDEENERDEAEAPVGSKIYTGNVQSLRLDLISKVGFGLSRNKIDQAFYESKLRVNGKKVFKKSIDVRIGDEVDLILHRHTENPKLIFVNKIILLSVSPAKDSVRIKLSRDRNLLIDDYEDPWTSS